MEESAAYPSVPAEAGPASRFLVDCVRGLFSVTKQDAVSLPEGGDGNGLLFAAASHGILPLLGVLCLDDPHKTLPQGATEQIRRATYQTVLNHAAAMNMLGQINRSFSAAGIPCAVLKGPYLYETLYAKRFPRPYEDLDILIPRERLDAAINALTAMGYRFEGSRLSRAFLRQWHFHVALRPSAPGRPPVELHWSLVDRFNLHRLRDRELMARIGQWEAGGASFGALALEDEFIYLCLHAAKHGSLNSLGLRHGFPAEWFCRVNTGNRLLWWADIALFIQEHSSRFDWDRLAASLREWNVKDDVFDCLRVMALLLPESPAVAALDRLGGSAADPLPAANTGWMGRWLRGRRGQRFLDRANVMHPALLIRPVRLLTLGRLLFPGPERLLAYYRTETKWLLPLLYAWHPFHLAHRLVAGTR